MINEYFNTLEDWKRLPSYKLEVRIDSYIGFTLPRVIEDILRLKTKVVIPELPIRSATLDPELEGTKSANRSYKVDFYIRTWDGQNLFIEVKTDSGSLRDEQDHYLRKSADVRMKSIVEGILKISEVTTYRQKYDYLLEKLIQGDLVNRKLQVSIDDEEIRVIYIQPKVLGHNNRKEIIDFERLAKSIRDCYPEEEFLRRLSGSLQTWGAD